MARPRRIRRRGLQSINLLDLPNELLSLVFEYLSPGDLLNICILCHRLNRLAITTIYEQARHRPGFRRVTVADNSVNNGLIRAVNLKIPPEDLTHIECMLGVDPVVILKETQHILESRVQGLMSFQLMSNPVFNVQSSASAKDFLNLFSLISEKGSRSLQHLSLSSHTPISSLSNARFPRRKALTPLQGLSSVQLMTQLITYPVVQKWLTESLNASPVNNLTLGGTAVDFSGLIKSLKMTHLQHFSLSSGCKLPFTEMHKFLARHSQTLQTLQIDEIISTDDQSLKAIPIRLVKTLRNLSVPPSYLPSLLPKLPKEASLCITFLAGSFWAGAWSTYVVGLQDALEHIRKWGAAASNRIQSVNITLGHDVEGAQQWMRAQLNEMEKHTRIENVTSLTINCWRIDKMKDVIPEWVKGRFTNVKTCTVMSSLQDDEAIFFARKLAMMCQSMEYVQLNYDRRHVIDWMNAELKQKTRN